MPAALLPLLVCDARAVFRTRGKAEGMWGSCVARSLHSCPGGYRKCGRLGEGWGAVASYCLLLEFVTQANKSQGFPAGRWHKAPCVPKGICPAGVLMASSLSLRLTHGPELSPALSPGLFCFRWGYSPRSLRSKLTLSPRIFAGKSSVC